MTNMTNWGYSGSGRPLLRKNIGFSLVKDHKMTNLGVFSVQQSIFDQKIIEFSLVKDYINDLSLLKKYIF